MKFKLKDYHGPSGWKTQTKDSSSTKLDHKIISIIHQSEWLLRHGYTRNCRRFITNLARCKRAGL